MGIGMGYGRFVAMIATSTVVMFGLMYLNTYALSHVQFSQTRTWMALVMGAVMAVIMLSFMWGMYKNTRSEEHTSELQSLMRISYAVFCLKKKKTTKNPA